MKLFATCCLLVEGFAAAAPQIVTATPATKSDVAVKVTATKVTATPATKVTATPPAPATKVTATPATVAAPAPKRAKLDVGFASFETGMMDQILVSMKKATESGHWSEKFQLGCRANATEQLSQGLKSQLLPLKQSIGKTWMSLPDDDSKNAYVAQLRSSYEPVFKDITATIDSHLQRTFKRLVTPSKYKKALSQDELLAECSSSILGNIINEHCYDLGGDHVKKTSAAAKKPSSFLQISEVLGDSEEESAFVQDRDPKKNFCMKSVTETMISRLKDSQGLIGMTMQFEAKSMALQPAAGALDGIMNAASGASK